MTKIIKRPQREAGEDELADAFNEAQDKLTIARAIADRYGPQAGLTTYEVLVDLPFTPDLICRDDLILVCNDGIQFPLHLYAIRTINPKELRTVQNCGIIRSVMAGVSYCFNVEASRKHEKDKVRESALGMFRQLDKLERQC